MLDYMLMYIRNICSTKLNCFTVSITQFIHVYCPQVDITWYSLMWILCV